MGDTSSNCKVAAVQAAPVFMDLSATVEKTCGLIKSAAEQGCDLVAFPETWIPGYPWFIWLNAPALNMKYFGQYHENSLVPDSEAYRTIARCARDHNIYVSIGASERDHGSLYIAQFLFGRDGETLSARRKLKPTHVERTVYGDGDGSDLKVAETDIGIVGQLACWEHLQPLSRYAMFSLHEQIHVAAWPSFSMYPDAYSLGPVLNNAASQMYAAEGQCFVVAPCGVISQEMIDLLVENETHAALIQKGGGYARVFGPDGAPLGETLDPEAEGLVVADIDLGAITIAKCFADPVGHYSRPDATGLVCNRQAQTPARAWASTPTAATPPPEGSEDIPAEDGVEAAAS
ncbi:MAG: carbon-nitrogen hydrolase family protein [Pseudomonadota bacterium]